MPCNAATFLAQRSSTRTAPPSVLAWTMASASPISFRARRRSTGNRISALTRSYSMQYRIKPPACRRFRADFIIDRRLSSFLTAEGIRTSEKSKASFGNSSASRRAIAHELSRIARFMLEAYESSDATNINPTASNAKPFSSTRSRCCAATWLMTLARCVSKVALSFGSTITTPFG